MNKLLGTTVYLSGAIEAHQSPETWRNRITKSLKDLGIVVYDPLVKPKWMPNVLPEQQASWKNKILDGTDFSNSKYLNQIIRKFCLRLSHACDFMIVKIEKNVFTAGTFEEIKIASDANKPVLFLCDDPVPSMWLVDQVNAYYDIRGSFFTSEDNLIGYLNNIASGSEAIDEFKWIFLTMNE